MGIETWRLRKTKGVFRCACDLSARDSSVRKRGETTGNLLLIIFRCGRGGLKTLGIYGTMATLGNLLAPLRPRVTLGHVAARRRGLAPLRPSLNDR